MALCTYGSSPKPSSPATYWITSADIESWVGPDTFKRLSPWVWNLAEQLVAIPDLCSKDPPQPPVIADGDILLASTNPLSAAALAYRLNDFAKWWAWSQFCQCNGGPSTCVSTTIPSSISTNMTFWTPGQGYAWPTSSTGINPPSLVITPYQWSHGCMTVDITCDTNPHVANFLMNPLYVYDGVGQVQEYTGYAGTTCTANLRLASGQTDPTINMIITTFDAGHNPNWNITIAPHAYTPPAPTPAPPPANINITVQPYPTPPCSSITDICAIIWNIKNYQTSIINNTYFQSPNFAYQGGAQHTIEGQGELAVAQGTLGLAATVILNPPALDPRPTDPNEYWNLGWIRTGNTVGWDRKAWIRTSGQRIFPTSLPFTKYAWTLADGVKLSVEELIPIGLPPP